MNPLGDAYFSHAIAMEQIAGGNAEVLRGLLWDLRDELAEKIVAYPDLEAKNLTQRQQAQLALFAQVDGLLTSNESDMISTANALLRKTAKYENQWQMGLFKGIGVTGGIPILTPEQLHSVATNALVEGAPSAEWWSRQNTKIRSEFSNEIRKGVLSGETVDDMIRRIRGTATGKRAAYRTKDGKLHYKPEFTGGIMDVNTRQAEALVRTSSMQVVADTRRTLYASSPVVSGIQQVSFIDERTTDICRRRNHKVWLFERADQKAWRME